MLPRRFWSVWQARHDRHTLPSLRSAVQGRLQLYSAPSGADDTSHPVIIAGAGPTGLTLAMLLSKFGIHSLVLERSGQLSDHPQAHYINNRSMEVMRPLDGLSAEVAAATPPLHHWRKFRYCFAMAGELLGEVDHFAGQTSAHNTAISPEPVAHVPQNRLLPMMLKRVANPDGLATVLWNRSIDKVTTSDQGVIVTTKDQQGRHEQFRGKFLAAADGASSIIRKQLGIPETGKSAMQHLINIRFICPSLGRRMLLQSDRPKSSSVHRHELRQGAQGGGDAAAMLYFVFNRDVVGVVVAHDLVQGEFVAQVPFFPPLQSPADFTETTCRQLVSAAAGLPQDQLADLRIRQVRPWVMSAVVADRYHHPHGNHSRSPLPRVFLLGDAAHRFPPAGGFGMNTGIQDAHNLAWKLALVIQTGGPSRSRAPSFVDAHHLLTSYEAERLPVASANSALSISNWDEAVGIPSQLGLDPRAAALLDGAVRSVPLPNSIGKALLQGGLAMGRLITTSWTPLRPWQMSKIKKVFDSGVTLRLQFPQEDLGFRYTGPGTAIVMDDKTHNNNSTGTARPGSKSSLKGHRAKRGLPYVPRSDPGCRLPHVWLKDLDDSASMQAGVSGTKQLDQGIPAVHGPLSTLDVVVVGEPGPGRLQAPEDGDKLPSHSTFESIQGLTRATAETRGIGPFLTLFVDGSGSRAHETWLHAADALREQWQGHGWALPLQVVLVVQEQGDVVGMPHSVRCRVMQDVHGVWYDTMKVAKGSVLLVRPDGHVAWRHEKGLWTSGLDSQTLPLEGHLSIADAFQELERAMGMILGTETGQ